MTSRTDSDNYAEILNSGVPLLDVRAPVEFSQGAFPGAINLPLMEDEERHRVGTRYKQAGQDSASIEGRIAGDDLCLLKMTRSHEACLLLPILLKDHSTRLATAIPMPVPPPPAPL